MIKCDKEELTTLLEQLKKNEMKIESLSLKLDQFDVFTKELNNLKEQINLIIQEQELQKEDTTRQLKLKESNTQQLYHNPDFSI